MMPRSIAFLRAINVGGHVVKMDALRTLFEELGCREVETFIASGNVIFTPPPKSGAAFARRIEAHLQQALGFEVATFLRTGTELSAIAQYRPFRAAQLAAAIALNVGFLEEPLGKQGEKALVDFRTEVDDFHVHGRELYWLCKIKQSDSRFSNVRLERALGLRATWRNANTVAKLAAKYPSS
jgi:uncharacterized protein (DUF1697 family)